MEIPIHLNQNSAGDYTVEMGKEIIATLHKR
jgi:hypothetical protein